VLARNPADAFRKRLPKVERRQMATLSVEPAAQLLSSIKHTRVYWPVMLALATGARRGEVLAMRWRSVDLPNGAVRIVESLEQTKAGQRFKSPKTEKVRAITLPRFAVDELVRLNVSRPSPCSRSAYDRPVILWFVPGPTASQCSRAALPMNLPD